MSEWVLWFVGALAAVAWLGVVAAYWALPWALRVTEDGEE